MFCIKNEFTISGEGAQIGRRGTNSVPAEAPEPNSLRHWKTDTLFKNNPVSIVS